MKDINSDDAKRKNIIDMAFAFSAMTRVFEKKSTEKIVDRLDLTLSQISSLKNARDYQNIHDDFCQWFAKSVRTAEREEGGGCTRR